jgi:signal transduction histidine kinase
VPATRAPRSSESVSDRLARAEQLASVGQLAVGLAHEISSPVQYVGDSLRFLDEALSTVLPLLRSVDGAAERELVAEMPQCVAAAIDGIERIASVIRTIQAVAGGGSTLQSVVNLNAVAETAIAAARCEWKYVATVTLDLDASLPPIVCLAGDMHQALVNIVVNAAQAIEQCRALDGGNQRAGAITVATRAFGDSLEVRIGDNGIGIVPGALERVFDPFFTTKPLGQAAGLGLTLANRVVRARGGRIYVESTPGLGSTFTVALPVTHESTE